MEHIFDFYTQYSQFYIADKFSPKKTDDDFWNEDAYSDRLALEDGIIGVGTECYGPVKGVIRILNEENSQTNLAQYDHIVEGSLEVKSGIIQVLDCPASTIQLEVFLPPNWYKVRVLSSNLESVDGDEGDDYYEIEIWPENKSQRKVLKRFN